MTFHKLLTPWGEQVNLSMKSLYQGHLQATYRGVKVWKCPMDYVIYQMIITKLQPDLVIEIGTFNGGTTLYIADLMDIIGCGEIHSIDIEDLCDEKVKLHPRIRLFTNGWESYDLNMVYSFKKILVIEDSSHSYKNTLKVMEKFADIVSPNSYLIVEDGIVNELGMKRRFQGGPLKAINEFIRSRKDYVVDRTFCDLFGKNATFNVNGYLKRIDFQK
jgi:cephalosporin hydroxylase